MALVPGSRLGPYQILSPIGAGGMGQVYKARDTKLGRDVAVKVLRPDLAPDPDHVKRFAQEARAASALNHPNIITIHDIGDYGGAPYIVMEYVEGVTLGELLSRTPLSNEKVVRYARQIAEGLAKAHQAGIVHRDLKPDNILISEDGYVKILDFGLAKLKPEPAQIDSEMRTLDRVSTREGVLVGTVPYMSPEQAAGEAVDFRSDQFALGSILYEMATGKRPFGGATVAETLTAILRDEPVPARLANPRLAASTARVIDRCLSKDPANRYSSTSDLAKDISLDERSRPTRTGRSRLYAILAGLAALALVLVVFYRRPVSGVLERVVGGTKAPKVASIAVLPFENLSTDAGQEYFVDGVAEALITDLAHVHALRVTSSMSSMRFRDSGKSIPEIAHELNVDALVDGSVLRIGDRVRVSVQLIDGASDRNLWAESYDRDLGNALDLMSSVSRQICDEIAVAMTPEDEQQLEHRTDVDPKARDAYMKGQFTFRKFTIEDMEKSLEYYSDAVEIDPDFADAWARLAGARFVLHYLQQTPASEFLPQTKREASRALELDPDSAEGLSSQGWIALVEWDWPKAKRAFERAIEINPNHSDSLHGYGDYLTVMGKPDEGLSRVHQAWVRDPFSPMWSTSMVTHFYMNGRFDDAIAEARSFQEMNPDRPIDNWLANAYFQKGMYEDAMTSYRREFRDRPDLLRALEKGYESSGGLGAVGAVAEEMARQAQGTFARPFDKARWFARAQLPDRALEWLEDAYEQHTPELLYLPAYPEFDPLHSDPRFRDLLRRMNLPP
jgi:eukaryotic-like serine/threonine-protein kinase